MYKIPSEEIQRKFLDFFHSESHAIIDGASIIPKNDPTLLFINSGMAPIKNLFTGEETPMNPRLCNSQTCIRTIDIDSIGDRHHLTSFKMLGNWSINDYFKEGAIKLSFEFLTKCLKLPIEKLYVTVFAGNKELGIDEDVESPVYWEKVGIPKSHIVKCGMDNFWGPTSDTGPCGPCTEIFYDTGTGEKNKYTPDGVFDTVNRYIEIWNAGVFMQFNKNADGTYSKLSFNSVDAGAGLERLSMVLNSCATVYDTDLLLPIKNCIKDSLSPIEVSERDLRILTDHLKTTSIILSEGVYPSNEGRGYIPRKLIRKCMLILHTYGIENCNFNEILKFILENYSNFYPKFLDSKSIISEFNKEVRQFEKILNFGLSKLEGMSTSKRNLTADDAFNLVTTYGLPIEIVQDFCEKNKISLNLDGYDNIIRHHKEISKTSVKKDENYDINELSLLTKNVKSTEFVGYEQKRCQSKVLKIIANNSAVNEISEKNAVVLVLDKTCFYAESGGQSADIGYIYSEECRIRIDNVKKNSSGIFLHFGEIVHGKISINDIVTTEYDVIRRRKLANNHSSVHLLQSALRELYGKNLHQYGSKVDDDKLRFDFNCEKELNQAEIFKIEQKVNSYIMNNVPMKTETKSVKDAISEGAIALFDSKYGENVRVVTFGDISKELCGGTHASMTGNIGLFLIRSVEGVGKGIKRIMAITGEDALKYVQSQTSNLYIMSKILKTNPQDIVPKLEKYISKISVSQKSEEKITDKDYKILTKKNDLKCVFILKNKKYKNINSHIIEITDKLGDISICVCGDEKKTLIVCISHKNVDKFHANAILNQITSAFGGKGGGNSRIASGGISCDVENLKKFIVSDLQLI